MAGPPEGKSCYRMNLPLVPRSKLTGLHQIGSGAFGVVYRANHEDWGRVAVKNIETNDPVKKRHAKNLHKEAETLCGLRHTNIVLVMGVVMEGNFNAIIMEHMDYGALNDFLDPEERHIPWEIKMDFVDDIVLGMNYLHTRDPIIIHSDLKGSNVLVGTGLKAKIADFGLSQWRSYSRGHSRLPPSRGGTPTHIAPERWKDVNAPTTVKFDVYAFGILLWEILNGKEPFSGIELDVMRGCICQGQRPPLDCIPKDAPPVLVSLMTSSWHQEPASRPTFQDIKEILRDDLFRNGRNMEAMRANLMNEISRANTEEDGNVYGSETTTHIPDDLSRVMAEVRVHGAQTDDFAHFNNRGVFDQRGAFSLTADAGQFQPRSAVNQEIRRDIQPEPPTDTRNNPPQTLPETTPGTNLYSVHQLPVSLSAQRPSHTPGMHLEETDPALSLAQPSVSLESSRFLSISPDTAGTQQARRDRSLEIDGPPHPDNTTRVHHSQPDVEHDAVPSVSSPQSPNVEFPRTTELPTGDSRAMPSGATSLPPPYSAEFGTFNVNTPMNVGIGNSQPVLIHEKEGHGRTVIYNTGKQDGNKGFVQIGNGNYMVVNPPSALSQPVSRPKPPRGRAPTTSNTMITDTHVGIICKELGNHWKALGYKLGFASGELDAFKHDFYLDGLQEIIRQMLLGWKRLHGKKATRATLAKCLWEIDKFTLALKL